MIAALAERLGVDEQSLVALIRSVAGDKPAMQVTRQMRVALDEDITSYEPTGFTIVLAAGMETDFAMQHETEEGPAYDRLKSVTLRFRH
jgi:3-hydroxyisobutyrate dehydrogenase-like beta-hydroxyacid dehydrogenase